MPRQTLRHFTLTTKLVFTKISSPKVLRTYCALYIIGGVAFIEKTELKTRILLVCLEYLHVK